MREHLGADLDELMRGLVSTARPRIMEGASAAGPAQNPNPTPQPVGREAMRRCIFGAYMRPDLRPADRVYNEVTEVPALLATLESYMADHDGPHLERHARYV